MANKFHGFLGFVKFVESGTSPGKFDVVEEEIPVKGDLLRNALKYEPVEGNEKLNMAISNRFSFIAPNRVFENFEFLKFITWNNVRWNISNIEVNSPRLIVSISGVYNAS